MGAMISMRITTFMCKAQGLRIKRRAAEKCLIQMAKKGDVEGEESSEGRSGCQYWA